LLDPSWGYVVPYKMTEHSQITAELEDEDDDFGDFGGFEAAEVVAGQEAQPLPALLQSFVTETFSNTSLSSTKAEDDIDKQSCAGSTLDTPPVPAGAVKQEEHFAAFKQFSDKLNQESQVNDDAEVTSISWFKTQPADSHSQPCLTDDEKKNTLQPAPDTPTSKTVAMAADTVHVADKAAYSAVDTQAVLLSSQLRVCESRIAELEEEATQQKQRYDVMQARHRDELTSLRAAGQEALTLVVEEYKAQYALSLAEQRSAGVRELALLLSKESEQYQTLIKDQQSVLESALQAERVALTERLTEALQEQQDKHKALLEAALSGEVVRTSAAVERALEEQAHQTQTTCQQAVEEERAAGRKLREEERTLAAAMMEEERAQNEASRKESFNKQQQHCQECLSSALRAEQERCAERIEGAVDRAVTKVTERHQQQMEVEVALRRRALTGTDILLQAARQQIDSLLSEPPPEQNT